MNPRLVGPDRSPRHALTYLAQIGIVPLGGGEATDIVITAHNSRNSGYLVESADGNAYFLKMPSSPEQTGTLRHEAAVYRALSTTGDFTCLAPRFLHYEPDPSILVLQGFAHTDSSDPLRLSSRRSLVRTGRLIGRMLALLHAIPHGQGDPSAVPPPSFCLDLPPLSLRKQLGCATSELVRLVQHDTVLTGTLAQCRDTWRRVGWVHGEMKWPHCLLCRATGEETAGTVRLVDYELSGVGDPAWDIGCVFASYLRSWLAAMPSSTTAPPESMVSGSSLSPPDLQEAVTALWRAYTRQRRLTEDEQGEILGDAVLYAVASLLWRVFESCITRDLLPPHALLTLQVAHNLALRPREGARHLLGLPPG